jgi:ABC-type multidrug transport system ATPase subunit
MTLFGMLLMQEPEVMLVDEPVAGMTDAETEHTAALLVRIADKRSVVVVEHDLEFVRALDCRATVLCEGSVLSEGSIDFVQNDQRVIESTNARNTAAPSPVHNRIESTRPKPTSAIAKWCSPRRGTGRSPCVISEASIRPCAALIRYPAVAPATLPDNVAHNRYRVPPLSQSG